MALTKNPNKNYLIERKWYGEINRRYNAGWKRISSIQVPTIITNFAASEEQLIQFYLDQIQTVINELFLPPTWQNIYQRMAYERAMKQSGETILDRFPSEEAAAVLLALATQIDFSDLHRNEINFLTTRANNALTNNLNQFLTTVTSLVRDNITLPARELKTIIRNRFKVYRNSLRRIATTETAQAAQRASLLRAQEIENSTGLKTEVRWVTANDSRVRHLHAGWHGRIFTRDQALRNMQISPWNCRCALRPVVETRVPARENARFRKERKSLLASQKN